MLSFLCTDTFTRYVKLLNVRIPKSTFFCQDISAGFFVKEPRSWGWLFIFGHPKDPMFFYEKKKQPATYNRKISSYVFSPLRIGYINSFNF